MNKTILCTVADDRFGRKENAYSETQSKIHKLFSSNPDFGIKEMMMWDWKAIAMTRFYAENKALLDNTDPARNGRAYKPFVILEALKKARNGQFVIYTDCSPEMWKVNELSKYRLQTIHDLCEQNGGILAAFVKWSWKEIPKGTHGIHTHRNFTLDRCMDKMGLRFYEDSYQNASGFWCIKKSSETLAFVEEWLSWNLVDECCSLGWANVADDYSFWEAESGSKIGHRHDQSISGLLLSAKNWKFVDIVYNQLNPYNFLNFCLPKHEYTFIPALPELKVGDTVQNTKGTEMKVWKIENGKYVVGKSEASCYESERQNLRLVK